MRDRGDEGGVRLAVRRVVVGYRVVGAVWLTLLAVVVLAGSDQVDRLVVLGTVALAAGWATATAVVAARRPGTLASLGWIAADIAVAAWTVQSSQVAGSPAFYGGYPFSAVLLAVAGRGLPGGLVAVLVLSAAAVALLLPGGGAVGAPEVVSAVLIYVVSAPVLAWGVRVLRRAEADRLRVEATLAEERAQRERSQERAETAAHLHDSVLQTLALIQRRSGDPGEVTTLARRQERELRDWLGGALRPEGPAVGFRDAVERAATEVERDHQVSVEAVIVGDAPLDEDLCAVVAAAREALVNAATHAGVARVALFAEADEDGVSAFVRDRGVGFDPSAVPGDRRGVSESIVARLERHGGSAAVRSGPGRGTEVELRLPRVRSSGDA